MYDSLYDSFKTVIHAVLKFPIQMIVFPTTPDECKLCSV